MLQVWSGGYRAAGACLTICIRGYQAEAFLIIVIMVDHTIHPIAGQGFNLGFGLQQKDSPVVSDEVKEVLTDFGEIANLSDEMEEDEDTEQAYFEIAEYVRISALLCFSELATPPNYESNSAEKKIIH